MFTFFDDRCPYGVHELKVTVEDIVGKYHDQDLVVQKISIYTTKEKNL
jgi:hypothetical protein